MGSLREWTSVVLIGAGWGVSMFFILRRTEARFNDLRDVLQLAASSIWFGVVMAFGLHRSFQWPLISVTSFCVFSAVALGVYGWFRRRSSLSR